MRAGDAVSEPPLAEEEDEEERRATSARAFPCCRGAGALPEMSDN